MEALPKLTLNGQDLPYSVYHHRNYRTLEQHAEIAYTVSPTESEKSITDVSSQLATKGYRLDTSSISTFGETVAVRLVFKAGANEGRTD
jgi:hypothetical protein